MQVVVLIAGVVDPKWRLERLGLRDGTAQPDETGLPRRLSPFDEAALEIALKLRDADAAVRVTAAVIGDVGSDALLRAVMALRPHRAFRLDNAGLAPWDPRGMVRLLGTAVDQAVSPDLVLIGREFGDADDGVLPPLLAERRGWTFCAQAHAVAIADGAVSRIDALVNNAGYGLMTIFEGASREAIRQQFEVNLFGVMDVTRAILPHFRANRAGIIINISSGVGIFGAPMASIYTASKFALEGFSEALWYELAALGIRVKLVEPGAAPTTGFVARAHAERGSAGAPADYTPFIEHISRIYGGMASAADADAVEKVVAATFAAATDGSDRLRYQPTDDIRPIVEARRGASEDQYQELVRGFFVPRVAG